MWDATLGKKIRRSLGHDDREKAKEFSKEQSLKLYQGVRDIRTQRATVDRVFSLYKQMVAIRSPDQAKTASGLKNDERAAEMWTRFLGPQKDLQELTLSEWEEFMAKRATGAIDARANPVP